MPIRFAITEDYVRLTLTFNPNLARQRQPRSGLFGTSRRCRCRRTKSRKKGEGKKGEGPWLSLYMLSS